MKTATSIQYSVFSIQYPVSGPGGRAGVARRSRQRLSRGFTLIELLVVIGVIVMLAGMSFPALVAVKTAQARTRARAELAQIETAIENYKTKLGFYPPDNSGSDWTAHQIYYELMGTTVTNGVYKTLDGSASTTTSIMNCAKGGAGDDAPNAVKFLTGLKNGQFLAVSSTRTVLGVSMQGAHPLAGANNAEIVPYGYNSSSPAHNPKSFDLWVDIIAGGKTNRISNWSSRPIIVSTTAYPQ